METELAALLTVSELAKLLRTSSTAIYTRLSRGADLPPAIRVGKLLRWRRAAVAAWLETKEKQKAQ